MKTKKNKKHKDENKDPEEVKYKEIASGGVVYFLNEENLAKFLLLKHKGGKKHWDLPKGHLKRKETLKDCAIREVLEETGIPKDKLIFIKGLKHKNIYSKKRKFGRKYKKIVHLYLFQALTEKTKLSKEHIDYKWVKFEKLEKKLTFPQTTLPAFVEALEEIKAINE